MTRFRWALFALPVLIILAAGGYGVLWLYGARQAEEAANTWLAAQRAAGWTAEVDALSVGGFPGRIRVTGKGLRLEPPADQVAVPWRWQADGLQVAATAFSLREPAVHPLGPQRLTLPGPDGEPVTHTLTAKEARLDLRLDRAGQVVGFALDATDVAARAEGTKEPLTIEAVAASLLPEARTGDLVDLRESSYTAEITVRGLTVPPGQEPPLGPRGDLLEAHARILGPVALEPGKPVLEAVKAWRDEGGSVEMDRFYLNWAPLQMSAAGSIALDQSLQPVAALTARFQGFFQAVNRLEEVGVVRPREASVARVVLGVMAQRDPNGGAPLLAVPVNVQDRTVRVGPVQVMTLPAIRWGGRPPPAGQEIRPGFEVDRWGNVIRRGD